MKRERVMGVRKSRRVTEAAQKLESGGQDSDSMTQLPSEMLTNILLRLPLADIIRCRCVCKPLLDLFTAPEFLMSHFSQAGLVVFERRETQTKPYKIVEFVENLDVNSHRWGVVLNFNLPLSVPVHSSANGLLFLYKLCIDPILSICNPITRDYIKLPCPEPRTESSSSSDLKYVGETYGFGVSRISGQYKVVRMFMEVELTRLWAQQDHFKCQVYSVGTGSWRRIASGRRLKYDEHITGTALNGNLHWYAFDLNRSTGLISCFDLETEIFTTFSTPEIFTTFCIPSYISVRKKFLIRNLSVLGDCLCLCDNAQDQYNGGCEIDIWLMKEYGDDNSWSKDFVIRKVHETDFLGSVRPIKVFEDGDILIEWGTSLLYCSNKNRSIREINVSGLDCKVKMSAAIYTPSFVSLKTFHMEENVISY